MRCQTLTLESAGLIVKAFQENEQAIIVIKVEPSSADKSCHGDILFIEGRVTQIDFAKLTALWEVNPHHRIYVGFKLAYECFRHVVPGQAQTDPNIVTLRGKLVSLTKAFVMTGEEPRSDLSNTTNGAIL